MRTDFEIAHIRISVETPYELIVTGGYELYQTNLREVESFGEKEADSISVQGSDDRKVPREVKASDDTYEIRLVEGSAFPKMEGSVLFQNELNLYLRTKEGGVLHYFRIPLTRQAAAWCETTGKHSLTIHYHQVSGEYFRNAMGCFNAAAFENILYLYKKFLFHCSYVDVGGEAVLFSAHSGGGKTTHALLWEQCGFGEMINGDRAVLERIGTDDSEKTEKMLCGNNVAHERGNRGKEGNFGYMVHGLPIAGSSNVFKNRSLPLRAIFMLEKAPVNVVVEMPPAKQFLQVFEQVTIHTWDREFVSAATDFVADMVQHVPVKLLRCRPDAGAVEAVREALSVMKDENESV